MRVLHVDQLLDYEQYKDLYRVVIAVIDHEKLPTPGLIAKGIERYLRGSAAIMERMRIHEVDPAYFSWLMSHNILAALATHPGLKDTLGSSAAE